MLFGRREKEEPVKRASQARPLLAKEALCRVCAKRQTFTRCWLRVDRLTQCTCCGAEFSNPDEIYRHHQPVCPRCEEGLEQPGFEYGFCDVCGSKYELIDGTKPSLMPNQAQRAQMNKHGKVWRRE